MDKEDFMQPLANLVSVWKWRLSAGKSGSSSIKPYPSSGVMSLVQGSNKNSAPASFGGINVVANFPESFPNPDLKWEDIFRV